MTLEFTELADGYRIPRLINGGWQLSQGHADDTRSSEEVLRDLVRCVDAGLTAFDCADIYTGVEDLLGELTERVRRDLGAERARRIRVHTKCVPDLDLLPRITRGDIVRLIDRSLRRLRRERLDLVQFHWWDYEIPGYVDTILWLEELRQAGKIHHLGVTNFDVPRLREMAGAGAQIVAHQLQYSLLDRRPLNGMARFCAENGITLLAYGTLAGGFLTDKWLGRPAPESPFTNRSLVKYRLIIEEAGGWDAFQALLGALKRIADHHGATIARVAVRWLLDQPSVGAAIVGTRGAKYLDDTLRIFDLRLDTSDIAAIDVALSQLPSPPGDTYTLERDRDGVHGSIMRYNLNAKS